MDRKFLDESYWLLIAFLIGTILSGWWLSGCGVPKKEYIKFRQDVIDLRGVEVNAISEISTAVQVFTKTIDRHSVQIDRVEKIQNEILERILTLEQAKNKNEKKNKKQ